MKIKLKFVIDTNIFVAGLINSKGACRKLIDHFLFDHFTLIICREIYQEYEYVLLHSDLIARSDAIEFLGLLRETALFCKIANTLTICTDRDDNKFLEAALESSAEYLVTKNIRHYPYKKYQDVKIVRISKALDALEKIF